MFQNSFWSPRVGKICEVKEWSSLEAAGIFRGPVVVRPWLLCVFCDESHGFRKKPMVLWWHKFKTY